MTLHPNQLTTFAVQWEPLPNGLPDAEYGYLIEIDRYDTEAGLVQVYLPTSRDTLYYRRTTRPDGEAWEAGVVGRATPR